MAKKPIPPMQDLEYRLLATIHHWAKENPDMNELTYCETVSEALEMVGSGIDVRWAELQDEAESEEE